MHSSTLLLLSITILLCLTTDICAVEHNSALSQMIKSIDQTCNNIHGLLTYQRRIIKIEVTKEAPLRIKVDMELTSQYSPTLKQRFSVEGMVCHHGFDRNAGEAACRSKKKKFQMAWGNYTWEPTSNELNDKCYFEYNDDPFIVPCHFILDNFDCSSDATSLNDCTFSPLFHHHCTNDMHVGIACS